MSALPRRRKIGRRRRVEDEGDDEGHQETVDLEDDSLTEGSLSDDNEDADDSDTSNVDEASPTSLNGGKTTNAAKSANGTARGNVSDTKTPGVKRDPNHTAATGAAKKSSETDAMLHGLSITDQPGPPQEMHFDDVLSPPKSPSAPVVVSSEMRQQSASHGERRKQEHEDYKRRRDEDPAFVPNRGTFFMHDHRHAGPAANGFRPFGRGRGRGGRFGVGGPFAPFSHMQHPSDPTTNSPWTHDMHEAVLDPVPRRSRQFSVHEGPPNGTGHIPTCEPSASPINRTLSTEKHIGNLPVRVFLPDMKVPAVFPSLAIKQYTKLPDHRPPLRRDKPVRISLPANPPRYIFPASDRSFTFIPRNMRPNQQRVRGKPRSNWGSVGGFSRRTSVFGGSFYGSAYSPSVALSRRSSVAHERDFMFSPTGSIISRPALPADNGRPIVRLPPSMPRPDMPIMTAMPPAMLQPMQGHISEPTFGTSNPEQPALTTDNIAAAEQRQPQLPAAVPENRPGSIPMHQPRPQKNISVADIEPPGLAQGALPFQQAFHQHMPVQVSNGYGQELHGRRASYSSQHASGTPLSHIPERAIHAAPFQPTSYGHQPFYGEQGYQQQTQPAQGYFYPTGYSDSTGVGHPYASGSGHQTNVSGNFTQLHQGHSEHAANPQGHSHNRSTGGSNLVAQEVNGMVYYYDASQIPSVSSYPPYSAPQPYQTSVMGIGGMVTPSPDAFYYPQHASGMVYYPQ